MVQQNEDFLGPVSSTGEVGKYDGGRTRRDSLITKMLRI